MALKVRISWSDSAIVPSSAARYSAGLCLPAERRLGAVAQPRQRRLQIVGDVVGDLLQPLVQLGDPGQHGVEVFGKPVELVAGAGHRQPAAKVAAHDAAACLGDIVDALQRARPTKNQITSAAKPHHAERRHQRAAHDDAEALRLAEIAADQHDHLVRQAEHHGDRGVPVSPSTGLLWLVRRRGDRCVAARVRLRRSAGRRTARRPALGLEHAGLQALDIAGQDAAVGVGDQIEVGAGLARALLDHAHQQRQAAALIGAGEALHLLVDRLAASARSACAPTARSCRRRAARRRRRRAGDRAPKAARRSSSGWPACASGHATRP